MSARVIVRTSEALTSRISIESSNESAAALQPESADDATATVSSGPSTGNGVTTGAPSPGPAIASNASAPLRAGAKHPGRR